MDYKKIVLELRDKGLIIGDEAVGFRPNPYLEMPRSLAFSDVAIGQEESDVGSRLDTDISSEFVRGLKLDVPLIAANMSAVVNADFCILLRKLGALGVMHRAWSNVRDYIAEVAKVAEHCDIVAASIGAGQSQLDLATHLVDAGANVIVIDIAQGMNTAVYETGRAFKKEHPEIKLIVGNTINPSAMYKLAEFADGVKLGVAQGAVCETKNTAGCTSKMWTVVDRFRDVSQHLGLPVISDGGISEPADFTKALATGANSVMAGKIFARCPESASDMVYVDGVPKKMYFGMASREAQNRWRGGLRAGTCPEGKTAFLDLGESAEALVERYSGALRSGMTYAGARDISSFQQKAKFERL